jgi:hypothetical protein
VADTVLFLDVDGTLLPFGPGAGPVGDGRSINPLLTRLNPAHGPSLLALGCTLVWATGWMDEANDEISDVDQAWVADTHPAPALLHRVESHIGLTDRDLRAVQQWLAARS